MVIARLDEETVASIADAKRAIAAEHAVSLRHAQDAQAAAEVRRDAPVTNSPGCPATPESASDGVIRSCVNVRSKQAVHKWIAKYSLQMRGHLMQALCSQSVSQSVSRQCCVTVLMSAGQRRQCSSQVYGRSSSSSRRCGRDRRSTAQGRCRGPGALARPARGEVCSGGHRSAYMSMHCGAMRCQWRPRLLG